MPTNAKVTNYISTLLLLDLYSRRHYHHLSKKLAREHNFLLCKFWEVLFPAVNWRKPLQLGVKCFARKTWTGEIWSYLLDHVVPARETKQFFIFLGEVNMHAKIIWKVCFFSGWRKIYSLLHISVEIYLKSRN